ncbi:unnamed protein product, partial [Mesorhabditis spiculigera]
MGHETAGASPAVHVSFAERDVLKVILEFLELRGFHIAQLALERETGVINGQYSADLLFLRQLIIDGQWDNALDFVEPLKGCDDFDFQAFRYNITKYKFFELLCIKLEPGPMHDNDFAVEELVECLSDLEHICPSPEDYRHLCAMLTLPRLSDHHDFRHWNPSAARIECFHKVEKMVARLLPPTQKESTPLPASIHDRLVSLVAKGIFYEGCVDYCQGQAVGELKGLEDGPKIGQLLSNRPRLSGVDLSLVSWLGVVSREQFAMPFQQKGLDTRIEPIKKPKLEAQWAEQILATPIKPGGAFPHSAVPKTKLRFAEKMSQSIAALPMGASMAMSTYPTPKHVMSQSTAPGFTLNGKAEASGEAMVQSQIIDAMLETSELAKTSRPGSVAAQSRQMTPMSMSVAPQVLAPAMAQSMSAAPFDFTQTRRQLDEMTRRSVPPSSTRQSSLPPVPELSPHSEDATAMTQSRLFQEFASRQKPEPAPPQVQLRPQMPMPMPHLSPQPMSYPGPPVLPGYAINPPVPYGDFGMGPRPIYPNGHMGPNAMAPIATAMPRPLSMMGPASPAHPGPAARPHSMPSSSGMNVQFVPVCRYEDAQAIRASAFHPSGRVFAVGTNSKQMLICAYPDVKRNRLYNPRLRTHEPMPKPEILLSRPKQHRGSVYCLGFSPSGEMLATGSNDKSMRLMAYNVDNSRIGAEMELNCHDGTVRDLIFLEDSVNRTSLLISGGAGDCQLRVSDCHTGQVVQSYSGHSAPILGLYSWGTGPQFVSCSQDKTIRFWDVRAPQPTHVIQPSAKIANSPVTSVCVDPSGQLLVSGHEDASVALYDMTGRRVLQTFRPHGDEVRSVRFSNAAYYLLSASYDKRVCITDMRGDLMAPLMYLPVAEHSDKVIQCRWHPHEFSFLSTSADRSVVLWALPPP